MDYKTLSLILPENSSVYAMMEAAAIKSFINSDGKVTEYAFDGDTKTVYSGDTVIFDGSDMEDEYIPPQEPEVNENKIEENSSVGIIGGADGPTSVYISGNPIKAMLVPIVISGFIFFAIGYAVGTRKKQKRDE